MVKKYVDGKEYICWPYTKLEQLEFYKAIDVKKGGSMTIMSDRRNPFAPVKKETSNTKEKQHG